MEKLLELLREYSTLIGERTEEYGNPIRGWNEEYLTYPIEIMRIKSKEYGFIERLVKNDKIKWSEKTAFVTFLEREINANKSDTLVSLLAVKDNPIEYLCSILKE